MGIWYPIVGLCIFHFCPLLTLLRDHTNMQVDQPSKLIPRFSSVLQPALEFWSWRDLVSQRVPLQLLAPILVLKTDMFNYGSGAVSVPRQRRVSDWEIMLVSISTISSWRRFSPYWRDSRATNYLKLETVFPILKRFQSNCVEHMHSLVQTDSTTLMHYLNKMPMPGPGRSRSIGRQGCEIVQ